MQGKRNEELESKKQHLGYQSRISIQSAFSRSLCIEDWLALLHLM